MKHRKGWYIPTTKCKIYSGVDYYTLAGKLSPEELTCISHCAVFDDCAADGNCELQNKVYKIIGE